MRRTMRLLLAPLLVVAAGVAGCTNDIAPQDLIRSDPPVNGMVVAGKYRIDTSANGGGELNQIQFKGMNAASPMPIVTTGFERGAGSVSQVGMVTAPDGAQIAALSMVKRDLTFGLTEYLKAQIAQYEQRDFKGNRVCGAKVRLTLQPNFVQTIFSDQMRRAWDALFYYSVPCAVQGTDSYSTLDLPGAKLMGLVINQQFTPRVVFGKPLFFNRGHSVTVVGGRPERLVGGWWLTNQGILSVAKNLVIGMVRNLDGNEWLRLTGEFADSGLVYSAGDADVYASLNRLFLNRQSDYLVNFRSKPSDPWQRVLIHPEYNKEWNDFSQNWQALKGQPLPNLDDLVDSNTGLPRELDNPDSDKYKTLKEIETAGCQNCPNPELEQIAFLDAETHDPLYAMTIRGYLGAHSSLVMFGNVPGKPLKDVQGQAEQARQQQGVTECPIRRDNSGNALEANHQYTKENCAAWLREGALWDMLTKNPAEFGFDMVGQFQVRDNTAFASQCTGSGESTSCNWVPTRRQLDASYLFSDGGAKLQKAWTVLQLLGEVGMRTLGMSYASGAYDGSGLDFAMAQMGVNNAYYTDLSDPQAAYNPELLFALDARALQLPLTLGRAGALLRGSSAPARP